MTYGSLCLYRSSDLKKDHRILNMIEYKVLAEARVHIHINCNSK